MADHLEVETEGLRSAATSSEGIAAELGAGPVGGGIGGRTSHAAVEALNGALSSTRSGHMQRVDDHAGRLRISSGVYERSDDDAAQSIARTITV